MDSRTLRGKGTAGLLVSSLLSWNNGFEYAGVGSGAGVHLEVSFLHLLRQILGTKISQNCVQALPEPDSGRDRCTHTVTPGQGGLLPPTPTLGAP